MSRLLMRPASLSPDQAYTYYFNAHAPFWSWISLMTIMRKSTYYHIYREQAGASWTHSASV